jgi:hypothetical protein
MVLCGIIKSLVIIKFMITSFQNIRHGFFVAVGTVAVLFGATLLHLIPASIGQMTVSGIASWVIAYLAKSASTPAGSFVTPPHVQ